jgi:ankyrin repeat protein
MLLAGLVPMNPVSAAVHFDSADILREYLKRGVDPNMVDEVPLLSLAALANRPEVAKVLISFGADPNRKDKFGWTPIRHARSIEHDVPVVEPLIQEALKKSVSGGVSEGAN